MSAMDGDSDQVERTRQQGKTPMPGSAASSAGGEAAPSRAVVDRLDQGAAPTRRSASRAELRVGIVLWPGFPLLSLAGLCDGLRHAADFGDQSRQMRCSWAVLGSPRSAVTASCGVRVAVEAPLSGPLNYDYVAVIGGLLPQLGDADSLYPAFLQRVAEAGVPLIGICTGSFVLARLGLMDGHVACVHPFHVDDWKARHPDIAFETHRHYSISKDRITCAGGISIVELVAELVRVHCGADRAAKVVHQMTVKTAQAPAHITLRHALGYDTSDHQRLRQAVVLMEKNITTPMEIAVIARLVGTSSRQLERVFLAETGSSPSEYYRNTRLKYARFLLTTSDLPVVTIAYESGFSDASHFIRHFQQLYGMSPGRLRKALVQDTPGPGTAGSGQI